jgi:hypothetical protein
VFESFRSSTSYRAQLFHFAERRNPFTSTVDNFVRNRRDGAGRHDMCKGAALGPPPRPRFFDQHINGLPRPCPGQGRDSRDGLPGCVECA